MFRDVPRPSGQRRKRQGARGACVAHTARHRYPAPRSRVDPLRVLYILCPDFSPAARAGVLGGACPRPRLGRVFVGFGWVNWSRLHRHKILYCCAIRGAPTIARVLDCRPANWSGRVAVTRAPTKYQKFCAINCSAGLVAPFVAPSFGTVCATRRGLPALARSFLGRVPPSGVRRLRRDCPPSVGL